MPWLARPMTGYRASLARITGKQAKKKRGYK